jgi:hypothetical protein
MRLKRYASPQRLFELLPEFLRVVDKGEVTYGVELQEDRILIGPMNWPALHKARLVRDADNIAK